MPDINIYNYIGPMCKHCCTQFRHICIQHKHPALLLSFCYQAIFIFHILNKASMRIKSDLWARSTIWPTETKFLVIFETWNTSDSYFFFPSRINKGILPICTIDVQYHHQSPQILVFPFSLHPASILRDLSCGLTHLSQHTTHRCFLLHLSQNWSCAIP